MKSIHVTFEDHEFESLQKAKGNLSWHDIIITLISREPTGEEEIEQIVQERVREKMLRQQTLVSEETLQRFREDPEFLKASFEILLSDSEISKVLASAVADSLVQEVREKRTREMKEKSASTNSD